MKSRRPEPEEDGFFVRTKNNQGFMGAYASDPFMKAFISFSTKAPGPVLDVGAAYGVATIPCLNAGARVIANDIDLEHLQILSEDVDPKDRERLSLMPGQFPDQLVIDSNSIGAALLARVLHFFTGEEIQEAATRLYDWIAPNGKVFVTAETPYLKNIKDFIPLYEEKKMRGDEWPGWMENFAEIDSRKGDNLPKSLHRLDVDVLKRVFEEAGFTTEKCEFFPRPEFPESLQLDGRESVGYIGSKDQ